MEDDSLKRKRCWPRFGLRTLLAILLVCAMYFALGQPTKTLGVRDVSRELGQNARAQYKAPLLLEWPVASVEFSRQSGREIGHITERRSYYVWFFGAVAKLPFTNETMRDFVPPRQLPATKVVPDARGVVRPPTAEPAVRPKTN